jgi:hypothetical protein
MYTVHRGSDTVMAWKGLADPLHDHHAMMAVTDGPTLLSLSQ